MNLSHYSDHDAVAPYPAGQAEKVFTYEKPKGLWVSVDGPDDWAAWNESEQFRDTASQHRHQVLLADDHQVLVLDTVEKVVEFDARYSRPDGYFGNDGGPMPGAGMIRWRGIGWQDVAAQYQGVIIAPYQWTLRMDLSWYYAWDCASGCLWDPAAIKEVTLLGVGANNPDRT